MTEAVQVALIVSVAPTLAALASLWVNRKSAKKIEEIHQSTNGMKDALVASTAKASHLEGMSDQRKADQESSK